MSPKANMPKPEKVKNLRSVTSPRRKPTAPTKIIPKPVHSAHLG